jgi:ATP-dependent RNA helicase DeaD
VSEIQETVQDAVTFADLGLSPKVLSAVTDAGYTTPTPIQAGAIPHALQGKDVLGIAQTGTGKTAAFALPILDRLDLSQKTPQALVLAPTRELALQVCEAFERYANHVKGVHVLPVYGGQGYGVQLSALRRGVHVVVGDTDMVAFSGASAGDKVTYVTSKAILRASDELLEQLKKRVAAALEASPQDIVYERKRFWVQGSPERGMTLADIAQRQRAVPGRHAQDLLRRNQQVRR